MEKNERKSLKSWYKEFNQSHKRLCEIIRFIIVGGIATLIDYLVMGIVLYLFDPSLYPKFYNVWIGRVGDPSTIATVISSGLGFCVSLVANYLLSVLFVYEEKGNSKTIKGIILFVVLSVGGLLLNMLGMWLGYDICGINEWITKIAMTLIVLIYNYVTRKLFIFKREDSYENVNQSTSFQNTTINSNTDSISENQE